MSTPDIYLIFDGNCADAMRFYENLLGGTLAITTVAGSPMAARSPAEVQNQVMHARLTLKDRILMASDDMRPAGHESMSGFRIALAYPDVAEAQRVFDALAVAGTIAMPMQKTFWVEMFGMVTDRFGTPWMVSGGEPAMPA